MLSCVGDSRALSKEEAVYVNFKDSDLKKSTYIMAATPAAIMALFLPIFVAHAYNYLWGAVDPTNPLVRFSSFVLRGQAVDKTQVKGLLCVLVISGIGSVTMLGLGKALDECDSSPEETPLEVAIESAISEEERNTLGVDSSSATKIKIGARTYDGSKLIQKLCEKQEHHAILLLADRPEVKLNRQFLPGVVRSFAQDQLRSGHALQDQLNRLDFFDRVFRSVINDQYSDCDCTAIISKATNPAGSPNEEAFLALIALPSQQVQQRVNRVLQGGGAVFCHQTQVPNQPPRDVYTSYAEYWLVHRNIDSGWSPMSESYRRYQALRQRLGMLNQ